MKFNRNGTSRSGGITAAVILMAAALWSCAGTHKVPAQQNIAKADAAVTDAQMNEAAVYAALELNLAEEKLLRARHAFQSGDYERADWLAEEALADANLAEAKAHSARSQATVQRLQNAIQTLQTEIERRRAP
jgi:Domain of unknown function (DUF4398)